MIIFYWERQGQDLNMWDPWLYCGDDPAALPVFFLLQNAVNMNDYTINNVYIPWSYMFMCVQ